MRHTISLLVENEFGVLSRIAGLFSGRGFNIESLCVAESLDPTISTMTIVTTGNDAILEQILKQLNKLINVIKVVDVSSRTYTVMITGDEGKLKAFTSLMKPIGIKELVRTGPIAMARGERMLKIREKTELKEEVDG